MASRKGKQSDASLRCSFCHKSNDVVGKLISSPSDYPRAYICDECIAVCYSIIEDDRLEREPDEQILEKSCRFVQHPLAAEFLAAAEAWAVRDLSGWVATTELDHMRALAVRMLSEQEGSAAEGARR